MPQVKPVRVHSSSPYHEKFPPENLLNNDKKKWKCREQGEKKAYAILELSEPTEINGVDIGNEHSCFIEVQVGRKGFADTDFKELLLTSSFKTPNESRNSENPNRVRCFNKTALVESTAKEKWELVKLICTQPFNSRVQYGLSFVTLYTPEEAKKEAVLPTITEEVSKKKTLFSLREKSPDSDTENNSTSLFARWKQNKGNDASPVTTPARISAAAAIRDARSSPSSFSDRKSPLVVVNEKPRSKRPSTEAPTTPALDRNRHRLLYDDDDPEEGDDKLEKLIEKDKKRAQEELGKASKSDDPATPATKKVKLDDREINVPASSRIFSDLVVEKPKEKPKVYKPFRKLLEGVVLTISGIQNPERGALRSKAMEMGAKYRTDWDDSCTHLICAFKNTPKYNQVNGIGKIVRKDWVLQCYTNKKHIPWRRFALDNKEADKSESEDEIYDEATKEDEPEVNLPSPAGGDNDSEKANGDNEDDDDVMMIYDKEDPVIICDSGPDTEDEIEQVRTKVASPKEDKKSEEEDKSAVDEPVNGSTGEFLTGRRFFLDDDMGAVKIIKLNSIITKFGGKVIESKEDCDYWIKTTKPNSNQLSKKNRRILKPLWLEETADMECWLPLKRYLH